MGLRKRERFGLPAQLPACVIEGLIISFAIRGRDPWPLGAVAPSSVLEMSEEKGHGHPVSSCVSALPLLCIW